MRHIVAVLLAAGLAACTASHQQAGLQTVRLAIHQDPVASLPLRVAQTLGYYAENGLDDGDIGSCRRHEGAPGAARRQRRRCRGIDVGCACRWRSKGLKSAGFSCSILGRPRPCRRALPDGTIRAIRDLKGRDRWCLGSGIRESSDPQLSASRQWPLARRRQHRLDRDVDQLCRRTRAGRSMPRCCLGVRFAVFQKGGRRAAVPRRSPHASRRTAGVRFRGLPSLGLMAGRAGFGAHVETPRRFG